MAAGLVSHNITTASGVTFGVISWVPDTGAPDVGAVPVARITDGTVVAGIGAGTAATALRFTPASDASTLTVLQGANNGGTWQIEGKTGGSGILVPVHIDPTQLGSLIAGAVPTVSGGYEYEFVAASVTDEVIGTGAVGDYLESLLCIVSTAANSQVQIKDGNGTAITILPNAVGAGVGTYPIPIGLVSRNATTPGWKITTAAGVTVLVTGNFT